MQIEIPEKIRRLKQKYIDELYSKYEGDDIYRNMQNYNNDDANIFYPLQKKI